LLVQLELLQLGKAHSKVVVLALLLPEEAAAGQGHAAQKKLVLV
jgi:hypothetical protein